MSFPTRRLGNVRFVALVAVGGLLSTTLATFGLALAKTVKLSRDLLNDGWADELAVVAVLEAVDSYLLALVQLIVALGLFELFIGDLDLPDWLEIRSLEDLKKPILDVLVVFVAIKSIERYLVEERALDALVSVAGGALLILSLTAFRVLAAPKVSRSGYSSAVTQPDFEEER
ncbi:MAG: YqhA family protein [Acidimicrobiales bacterium]